MFPLTKKSRRRPDPQQYDAPAHRRQRTLTRVPSGNAISCRVTSELAVLGPAAARIVGDRKNRHAVGHCKAGAPRLQGPGFSGRHARPFGKETDPPAAAQILGALRHEVLKGASPLRAVDREHVHRPDEPAHDGNPMERLLVEKGGARRQPGAEPEGIPGRLMLR